MNYLELAYQIYNHIKNEIGTKDYYVVMPTMKETILKLHSLGVLSKEIEIDLLINEVDTILRSGKF